MASTRRVVDVMLDSATLRQCQTVSQLREQKPGVGAVLLGGNSLGPQYSLQDPDKLDCTVDAKHVCKASFVSSLRRDARFSTSILLEHGASAADLKREFYRKHRREIAPVMTASGAAGSADEQVCVDAIECKDLDGRIIADDEILRPASVTACADHGCHSRVFLDVRPSSMNKERVQTKLRVSSAAIDHFIRAPRDFGASYPEAFATVRAELERRLRDSTRPVPAGLSTGALEELRDFFQSVGVEDDDEDGGEGDDDEDEDEDDGADDRASNLPLVFMRFLDELVNDFDARRADALDPDVPRRMAEHISDLKHFVEKLELWQKKGTWINYQTETEFDHKSIDDVVEKVQGKQTDLQLHEDIHLKAENTANMTGSEKRENKDACAELSQLYYALHGTFEDSMTKRDDLSNEMNQCRIKCEESLVV